MPNYLVRQYTEYEIEADNEEEAVRMAEDIYYGSSPPDFEFEVVNEIEKERPYHLHGNKKCYENHGLEME